MRNARLVTLMSCQWADMDLDTLCGKAAEMGYDGIELAIWATIWTLCVLPRMMPMWRR